MRDFFSKAVKWSVSLLMVLAVAPANMTAVYADDGVNGLYKTVLGDAVNYGIVANTINQKVHMDSTFAAKTYNNNGQFITTGAYTNINGQVSVGSITSELKIAGGNTSNIYVECTQADENKVTANDNNTTTLTKVVNTADKIDAKVTNMITAAASQSATLAGTAATISIQAGGTYNLPTDQNKYDLDVRSLGAGVIYINDYEKLYDANNRQITKTEKDGTVTNPYYALQDHALNIVKNDNQTIVFNISSTSVNLRNFSVNGVSTANSGSDHLGETRTTARTVIFNMPNAAAVNVQGDGITGTIIAPQAAMDISSTCTGWVVCSSFTNSSGEWHCVNPDVVPIFEYDNLDLTAVKHVGGDTPTEKFNFTLAEYDSTYTNVIKSATVQNNGETIDLDFRSLSFAGFTSDETRYFKLTETADDPAGYVYDSTVYYILVNTTSTQTTSATGVVTTKYHPYATIYKNSTSSAAVTSMSFENYAKETNYNEDSFTVNKKNAEDEKLDDAVFGLYQDEACTNQITTFDGNTTISTADLHDYIPVAEGQTKTTSLYVKEISAPAGYALNTEPKTVSISAAKTSEAFDATAKKYVSTVTYTINQTNGSKDITVVDQKNTGNEVKYDSFEVTKYDSEDTATTKKPLSGAVFGVYEDSSCKDNLIYTFDGNTVVSVEKLGKNLPIDGEKTLYVKEITAPKGYFLNTNVFPLTISVSKSEPTLNDDKTAFITTTTYTVDAACKNIYVPDVKNIYQSVANGTFTIEKTDAQGNELNDAEFGIYQNADCTGTPVETIKAGKTAVLTNDASLQPLLPKANESITLYVKETAAPAGYQLNNTIYPVVIKNVYNEKLDEKNNEFIYTTAYQVITNTPNDVIAVADEKDTGTATVYDTFRIAKTDENGNALNGAAFSLYTTEDCAGEPVYTFAGNTEVSLENLKDVLPDAYRSKVLYVKETAAPAGYTLSNVVNKLQINATVKEQLKNGKYITTTTYAVDETSRNITVVDQPTTIKIQKTDDSQNPLAGASLELLDSTGNVVDAWTSNGTAHTVKALTVGAVYTLHEVSAPSGYEVAQDITVKIGSTAEAQVVTMVDAAVVTPKTNDKPTPTPTPETPVTPETPTTPRTPSRPSTPNTGDQTNAPLAAGMLGLAMLAAGIAFLYKKKYSD